MSERELRKVAGHKGTCRHSQTHYMSTPEPCTCGLDEAIAADPDLVQLLRKIREFQIRWSLSVPTTDALKLVKRHIEKTVRLTHCLDCGGSGYVPDGQGSGEPCGCNGQSVGYEWADA